MKQTVRWLLPALVGVAIFSNAALCGPHTPGHFFGAGNSSLIEYDATGTSVRSFSGVANLYDVAISSKTGNLFASNPTDNLLYSVDYTTGAVSPISSYAFNKPTDIAFSTTNDRLYAVNTGTNTVLEIWAEVPGMPAMVARSTIGQGYLTNPNGLAFNQAGQMYVSSGTGSIVVFDAELSYQATLNPLGLQNPSGLEFGLNGNLYAVSSGTNSVLELNPLNGQVLRVFQGSENLALADPLSLSISPGDKLLVADSQGIVEFDLATGEALARYADGTVSGVVAVAPEPATLALLGIGLGAMAYRRRKNS